MFKTLRGLTAKQEESPASPTGHTLTEQGQIGHHLSQAKLTRTLLMARLQGEEKPFTTAILDIQDERGFLILDEFSPLRGHQLFLKQGKVEINGNMQGVELRFETDLIEAGSEDDVAFYKVSIPTRLYYRQRRSDHRVPPGSSGMQFLGYRGQRDQQLIRGYLFDISRNGVGVILQGVQTVRPGELISGCTLPLTDKEAITFSLEARFVSKNRRRGVTRLGGCFREIDRPTLKKVRTVVNRLERAEARRLRERE